MAKQQKIQPQNIESEQSLLGAMMLSKDAVAVVIGKLKAESFYKPSHGIIFDEIINLFNNNEPIDLVTVSNALKKAGQLAEIGGRSYLIESRKLKNPWDNEIHIDFTLARKCILQAAAWPALADQEWRNGNLLKKDEDVSLNGPR